MDSTTAPAPEDLPVVDSFAITGWIHNTATGTAGGLTLTLPADTEVPTTSVIATLLTAGHRVLDDHPRTDRPLPDVDITTVDRTEKPSPTTPATGFTVHITNDFTTGHSDITVDADQLLGAENGTLLIATTLLAGAEHLLGNQDRPLHRRAPPPRRRRGHRGRQTHSPATQ